MKISLGLSITLLVLFAINFRSLAQSTGQVKGKVIAESDKYDVAYLTIGLYLAKDTSLVKGTLTNSSGEFDFDNIGYGNYLIAVNSLGYQKRFIGPYHLNPTKNVIIVEDLLLELQVNVLDQLEVKVRKPLIETKNNKTIVNVENSALSAGNSAFELIARSPAVGIDNNGNVSLRGKVGATIMIDDKPTYLSNEQLVTFLKSMSGSAISSIEIMTNPPARYDAAGTGGIINIKLKKNETYGTNGTANLTAGYGTFHKSDVGANLNHRNKSFNFFANYNVLNNKDYENLSVTRSTGALTDNTYFNQFSEQAFHRKNQSYKAGMRYYLNQNSELGAAYSGYTNNMTVTDDSKTLIGNAPMTTASYILAQNPAKNSYGNHTYTLDFKSKLDTLGQAITASLDYSNLSSYEKMMYNNYFFEANDNVLQQPVIFRNQMPTKINIWAGQSDYSFALNKKAGLEIGIKFSDVKTDNELISENLEGTNWIGNKLQSNEFRYEEQIYAAYGNFHQDFGKTKLQFGLRTEITKSEGNLVTQSDIVKRNYTDFFPNLNLSQIISQNQEIGFSFSRRIDRPSYQSLNPFIYYADLYTQSQGNPKLQPQYANAFELSYTYHKNNIVTFSYTHTNKVMTTVLLTNIENKTLLLTEQNLAARKTISLNVSKPITITKWWDASNDATLYNSKFLSPNLMGVNFENGKTTLTLNSRHSFLINPTLSAELSADYTSSQVFGTYIAKPIYGFDLGLSKSFSKKRATVKLAANDIFNQRNLRIRSAVHGQDYKLAQKQESRIFRLSFSYNFGHTSNQAVDQRTNVSETEQNRAKSGN